MFEQIDALTLVLTTDCLLKHMTPDCTDDCRIRDRIRLLTNILDDANRTDCFEDAKSLENEINQLRRQLSS